MQMNLQGLPAATRKYIIWGAALVLLFVAIGMIRGGTRVQLPVS